MLDFVFTQNELFWLDDILPGANKHNKHEESNNKPCEHSMSNDQIYRKKNLEASKSVSIHTKSFLGIFNWLTKFYEIVFFLQLEHMTLSKQNENHIFISSNESSNNNLSAETDIRYIDGIDESNSLLRNNSSDNHNLRNNPYQPVKFVSWAVWIKTLKWNFFFNYF